MTHRPSNVIARYICNGIKELGLAHKNTPASADKVVTVSVSYSRSENLTDIKPNQ
ncbi:hypothetical protein [Thalassotalea atypica]|uniref:hypothetical protein n=1 Tax=Thalassotalea atypica TaxID=2054316 RepID=UPI0025743F18|nr:hypothetical protein [Thalassotalea atypica]